MAGEASPGAWHQKHHPETRPTRQDPAVPSTWYRAGGNYPRDSGGIPVIESARLGRNVAMLRECETVFAARARELITVMEHDTELFRPRIQQAWRSPVEQAKRHAEGRSQVSWGFHNATGPNGEHQSLAVDLIDDDYPVPGPQSEWPPRFRHYLLKLACEAEKLKLRTGILWSLDVDPLT